MNNPPRIVTIQRIADTKGLIFAWDESLQCYCTYDKITKELLMEYANITVGLITNVNIWREEFNKLKAQSFG